MSPPRRDGLEWKHVSIVREGASQNQPLVECYYCQKQFHGGATRIRAHVLGDRPAVGVSKCLSPSPAAFGELHHFQSQKDEAASKKRKVEQLNRLDRREQLSENVGKQSTIGMQFRSCDKSTVDAAWARAMYSKGLPFHLIDDPQFKEAVKLTAAFGPSYSLPSAYRVSHKLLDAEVESVTKELNVSKHTCMLSHFLLPVITSDLITCVLDSAESCVLCLDSFTLLNLDAFTPLS
jgi:hypothetical protein